MAKSNPTIRIREEMEKAKIVELLDEPEVNYKYLDLGEAKGFWYYGFNIKGKEAIITSDGRILRNTLERFKDKSVGCNEILELFDYAGHLGDIAPMISKETVKTYFTKNHNNHLVNPKTLYSAIRNILLYYMDFEDKIGDERKSRSEIADAFTCWIIATYCYPLFYWFPHILINAPRESGKTKCAFILTQLGFRGYDLGASAGVTPAQIFRTLEANRGTILVDEFELAQGKISSETQQLVNQILNASATRDAYVIRNEQINRKWIAKKFPIYCPKIVCNITGINPTSLTRFIAFWWLKTDAMKGKRKPWRAKDKAKFTPLRNNLYIMNLENWRTIKSIYDELELSDVDNRQEDNWLPLFAVAKFIDSCEGEDVNAENQLKKFIADYKEIEIETNDNTGEFFSVLYDLVYEDAQYYTPKQIAEWPDVASLFTHLKSPAHKIGRILKNYKFKRSRGGGVKKYLLSKKSISKILKLYFHTDIITPNNT